MGNVIAAYIYTGWHTCSERNRELSPHFSEWDLVLDAPKRFAGHNQPRVPERGIYDDSTPETASNQIKLAREYGVDMFVYGFFWSRGKRLLHKALDTGFLGVNGENTGFPFSIMWSNRMPRGILPVKLKNGPDIEPGRLVYTDRDDFMTLIEYLERNYFAMENYFRIDEKPLFSIFDTTFFINQMGHEMASDVINEANDFMISKGYAGIHLMAINVAPSVVSKIKEIGFASHTHYVWLPDWKGEDIQDYRNLTVKRSSEWQDFASDAGITYFPSVSPGWDATPRAATAIHGKPKAGRYPWWPVVTGEDPENFYDFLKKAASFSKTNNNPSMVFVASWNEWSEGHYLEPDERFGTAWLEAVKRVKMDG